MKRETVVVLCLLLAACGRGGGGGDDDEQQVENPPRFSGEEIHKASATDAGINDRFGSSVAISGDYAIVGAPFENGGAGDPLFAAGAAYVFHRTAPDTWDGGVKLVAFDAGANDEFGFSVGIDGDYAIVGAHLNGNINNADAGAAYVFLRTGDNSWDGGTKLVAADAMNFTDDQFGHAVAISGDYAIVGARAKDGGTPNDSAGAAYVFRRTGMNSWDGGTTIVAFDAQPNDLFGQSVMIDGDYAVVGAHQEDGGAGDPANEAGAAYVFRRTGLNSWDGGTKLVAPDAQAGDKFGFAVGIDGDYVIAGAFEENGGDGDPTIQAGAAYLFHRTGANAWDGGIKIAAPVPESIGLFGYSVSIRDDYAVVGARGEDVDDNGMLRGDAGAAYIFRRTGVNLWALVERIIASDPQIEDFFGFSAAISHDQVIVGAIQEDGGLGDPLFQSGAAYLYR